MKLERTPSFAPSEPFGPYVIERRLAIGGMAEIWKAQLCDALGLRDVVLKTMLPHLAQNQEFASLFVREAALSLQLSHPNIAQAFDLNLIQGRYCLEMEYLEGWTLRQLSKCAATTDSPLPLTIVLSTLIDCCNALDYVHAYRDPSGEHLKLVHRDLSPDNVMVCVDGHAKLLDFGIATASANPSNLTRRGQISGKLHYMAPEVFTGAASDARRDLYAVGVTLYELLTGRLPFAAESDAGLILRVSQGHFAPPRAFRTDLPAQLDALVCATLAKTPSERPANALEIAVELRQVLERIDPGDRHDHTRRIYHRLRLAKNAQPPDRVKGRANGSPKEAATLATRPLKPRIKSSEATLVAQDPPPQKNTSITETRLMPTQNHSLQTNGPFVEISGRSRLERLGTDIFSVPSRAPGRTNVFELHPVGGTKPSVPTGTKPAEANPAGPNRADPRATHHFERGLELRKAGRLAAALDEWEEAARLDPKNRTYRTNVRILKQRME